MPLSFLQSVPNWDLPVFKVLAHNDSGNSKGNQAGFLIPKELQKFFPLLSERTSPSNPTTDKRIHAELFVENQYLGTVCSRYQIQTWSGTRSPEARLTDQLGPLRNRAAGGDILVIQRRTDSLDCYRLTLVRKSFADFRIMSKLVGTRRWGSLMDSRPLAQSDLESALSEDNARQALPFLLFSEKREARVSLTTKKARSVIFREKIIGLYGHTCALCDEALESPAGPTNIDAAHIVPVACSGTDDARNGMALCKCHHWAFDNGLFGIDADRKVIVPDAVKSIENNSSLSRFAGYKIREAKDSAQHAHPDALRWHRENLLFR